MSWRPCLALDFDQRSQTIVDLKDRVRVSTPYVTVLTSAPGYAITRLSSSDEQLSSGQAVFPRDPVALVGASPRPGSLGPAVLANLRRANPSNQLWLVNPGHAEIDGLECRKSLLDLAAPPNLVVIAVPPEGVVEVAKEACAIGSAAPIVITAGLGHGEGSLAENLRRVARASGLRIELHRSSAIVGVADIVLAGALAVLASRSIPGPELDFALEVRREAMVAIANDAAVLEAPFAGLRADIRSLGDSVRGFVAQSARRRRRQASVERE
jgi:predicted CoA-binding protein